MNLTKGKREYGIDWGEGFYGLTKEQHARNEKRRIYDRLRKASLRRINYMDVTGNYWTHMSHEAYVKGVREALNA